MDITLLYFEDCPNWKLADQRLTAIAAERDDITMTRHLVDTAAEAERTRFHGSPSILVDGVDVFAEPGSEVGLSCRRYPTPDGYQGAPTLDQLRASSLKRTSCPSPRWSPSTAPASRSATALR